MEIARLVLEYVQTLIWPSLVASVLWMGRKKIPELLARLRSVEAPGIKVSFAEALGQVEVGNVVAQALIESTPPDVNPGATTEIRATIVASGEVSQMVVPGALPAWWPTSASLDLAEVDKPSVVIARAWEWVERSVTELADAFGVVQGDLPILELASVVLRYTSIRADSLFEGGLSSLRKLRNRAVHNVSPKLSSQDAKQYIESALTTAKILQELKSQAPQDPPHDRLSFNRGDHDEVSVHFMDGVAGGTNVMTSLDDSGLPPLRLLMNLSVYIRGRCAAGTWDYWTTRRFEP